MSTEFFYQGAKNSQTPFPNYDNVPKKKIQHFSYYLNDQIGRGYSSQVFKGKNDLTDETVAIKVIDMRMLKNDVHRTLLTSEIVCLKKLNRSPSIIELYEVYTTKNNTYIVTELCQGGDLSTYVSKRKLHEKQAISFMQQLIIGYLQIYNKGIIHRDLKPANILMKGNQIKIADFGFSVKIEDSKKNSSYNVGSPLYMPPQTLLENKYSFKSDVWALGIIFYQLLTGQAPWKAKSQKQLSNKILKQSIKDLLPAELSQGSRDFLIKTLNPNIIFRISPQQLRGFTFESKKNEFNFKSQTLKSQRRVSLIKQNNVQKPNMTLPSINQTLDQDIDKINRKQISKQLLSYVHLCRFIFKLVNRIQECQVEHCEELLQYLANFILQKISNLIVFEKMNIYDIEYYKEYKETSDFRKIYNIVKQYQNKYKDSLKKYTQISRNYDYRQVSNETVNTIKNLHIKLSKIDNEDIPNYSDEVIVLDYLITTYQLINLEATKDIKEFNKKSKIQEIVEGATNTVSYIHLKAIRDKIQALNLL